MALHTLAANCDYRDMEEDLIRDGLVVGIRDLGLSKTLQLEATLDLEKAKKAIHQRESVQQQLQLQLQDASSTALEAIQPRNRRKQQQQGLRNRNRCGRGLADNSKHCTRCGKEPHSRDKCPAKDAICNRCQKKGHYGAQCLTKHKKASVDSTSGLDTAFLDSTTNETSNESAWFTNIRVGEHMVKFKMDTGAEVTAISHQTYEALPKQPPLNTSDKTLCGPAKKPLQVAGQCQLLLNHKGKSSLQQVFVVVGLRTNLLGLPAIQALNLIKRLDNTTADQHPLTSASIKARFSQLFTGLGNLGEEYTIQLKQDAKPFSLYTPRRIPLPLRGRVQEELDRMGAISKVDVTTQWCAGMVVPPKKSGDIHICVGLKPLNQMYSEKYIQFPGSRTHSLS